jgi:hypothetical protein
VSAAPPQLGRSRFGLWRRHGYGDQQLFRAGKAGTWLQLIAATNEATKPVARESLFVGT